MKRIFVLAFLVIALGFSCTIEQEERVVAVVERIGQIAPIGGAAVASTPLAPLAPIFALIGVIAGGVATVLRPKNKEVELAEVKPGLLDSRKTKIMALGTIAIGIVAFAEVQWGLSPELSKVIIAAITAIFGVNIYGIAREDSALKGNPK